MFDHDSDTRDEFEEFRARSYSGGFLYMDWPNATNRKKKLNIKGVEGTPVSLADMTLEEGSLLETDDDESSSCDMNHLDLYHAQVLRIDHGQVDVDEECLGYAQDATQSHEASDSCIETDENAHRRMRKKRSLPGYLNNMGCEINALQSSHSATSSPDRRFARQTSSGSADVITEDNKLDRSRHLSLKKSHRSHSTSPRRPRDDPPAIQVSVHRQVASRAPPEWDLEDQESYWYVESMRPRVCSLPNGPISRPRLSETASESRYCRAQRMRSFTITRRGIRKEYKDLDYMHSCSRDASALDSNTGNAVSQPNDVLEHSNKCNVTERVRVMLLGQSNVGKRAIIKRFVAEKDPSYSFDEDAYKSVSILLDGKESTIEFVDASNAQVVDQETDMTDAYVVVYSVEDRRSYEAAINRLDEIRETHKRLALILVANKTDLVRSRVITEEEGRTAANTYDSKYIEVSAAIDHNIDELLVGVLKQIRLIKKKYHKCKKSGWNFSPDSGSLLDHCCILQARANALAKIFKGENRVSTSTDNLFVL